MAATPVHGTIFLLGTKGQVSAEDITTNDVADDWVVFNNNGQDFCIMPFRGYINDIAMSGDGTDTKKWELYVNSRFTGITLRIAGLVNTVNNRLSTKIPIEKGSMVQLKEKA